MLILNPYTWEAEHYEPHGEKYKGQWLGHNQTGKSKKKVNGYWEPDGINLKQAIENINREIKKVFLLNPKLNTASKRAEIFSQETSNSRGGSLKYLPPSDVCPTKKLMGKMKSFQEDTNFSPPKLFEGVIISETDGYCAMWSLYFLDLRLKTMKQSVQKVYEMMANKLNNEQGDQYIELIRGMSKYGWEKLKILATPKYMVGYTKDDLIRYLGGFEDGKEVSGETDTEGAKNVEKALTKLRDDLQIELSKKFGVKKALYNNDIKTKFNFKLNPSTDPLTQNIKSYIGSGDAIGTEQGEGENMLVNLKHILDVIRDDWDFRSTNFEEGDSTKINKLIGQTIDWDNKPINKIPKKDRTFMKQIIDKYMVFRDEDAEGSLIYNMPDLEVRRFFQKYF